MRVILVQDVKSLGVKGDVVKVADGYARNYLLPRKMAVEATGENLAAVSRHQRAEERRASREIQESRILAQRLAKFSVTIKVKAGAGEKLFGSVTAKDIADAVAQLSGIKVDRRRIELRDPIRKLGSYHVPIKLSPDVQVVVGVEVVAE